MSFHQHDTKLIASFISSTTTTSVTPTRSTSSESYSQNISVVVYPRYSSSDSGEELAGDPADRKPKLIEEDDDDDEANSNAINVIPARISISATRQSKMCPELFGKSDVRECSKSLTLAAFSSPGSKSPRSIFSFHTQNHSVDSTKSLDSAEKTEKMGWLTKQGQMRKSWRKRWFELDGGSLKYYRSMSDKNCIGSLQLDCEIRANTHPADGRYFALVWKHRTMPIYADSSEEARSWENHLGEAIAMVLSQSPAGLLDPSRPRSVIVTAPFSLPSSMSFTSALSSLRRTQTSPSTYSTAPTATNITTTTPSTSPSQQRNHVIVLDPSLHLPHSDSDNGIDDDDDNDADNDAENDVSQQSYKSTLTISASQPGRSREVPFWTSKDCTLTSSESGQPDKDSARQDTGHTPRPPSQSMDIEEIKYVSLSSLISKLTPPKDPPNSLLSDVLVSYPCFTTAHEFFAALRNRYHLESDVALGAEALKEFEQTRSLVRLRVVNVLKKWLQLCPHDFTDVFALEVHEFMVEIQQSSQEGLVRVCVAVDRILKRKIMGLSSLDDNLEPDDSASSSYLCIACRIEVCGDDPCCPQCQHPMMRTVDSASRQAILEFSDYQIASHLMYVEHRMFRRIRNMELLHQAWTKVNRHEIASHVIELVQHFNKIAYWATQLVVREASRDTRAQIISRLISIAHQSNKLHNLNGTKEIITALCSPIIKRMKKTWQRVPNKNLSKFRKLRDLVSDSAGYAELKHAAETRPLPCLPFLGATLHAMMAASESLHRCVVDGPHPIPLHKCRQIAHILQEVNRAQQVPFQLDPLSVTLVTMLQKLPLPFDEYYATQLRPDLD